MILTNYFIKCKVNKLITSSCRKRQFKTIDQIKNILLIHNVSDTGKIKECIARLKELGKNVLSCGYSAEELSLKDDNTHIYIQAKKDINSWGMPSPVIVEKLNAFQPDIIIDLTLDKNYIVQYLLLKCNCDFKVGIKNTEKKLYDFSISSVENKDLIYLFEQIIFYLQTIRSK